MGLLLPVARRRDRRLSSAVDELGSLQAGPKDDLKLDCSREDATGWRGGDPRRDDQPSVGETGDGGIGGDETEGAGVTSGSDNRLVTLGRGELEVGSGSIASPSTLLPLDSSAAGGDGAVSVGGWRRTFASVTTRSSLPVRASVTARATNLTRVGGHAAVTPETKLPDSSRPPARFSWEPRG